MKIFAIFNGMAGGVHRRFAVEKNQTEWFVLNNSAELENLKNLPIELQYAIAIHPSRYGALEKLLTEGHGIAIGKQKNVPKDVVQAVSYIAGTHHGAIYPWLEDLVVKQAIPRWSESDFEEAADEGMDLKNLVNTINAYLKSSIQIKLIQSPLVVADSNSTALIKSIESDIQKINSLETAHALLSEHLNRSRDINFLFLLSFVLFAPVAHVLEVLFVGLGKFFAVLLPGLYYESLGMKRSYSHGAASWQIIDNFKAKWPELSILIITGVSVQILLSYNLIILAGVCFTVASCSIFTAKEIRRLKKARQVHEVLINQGKFSMASKTAWLKLYYGPIWWAHSLSIILSLFATVAIFVLFGSLLSNGWLLALMAIVPMLTYELLLLGWRKSLSLRFKSKVKKMLSQAIIS